MNLRICIRLSTRGKSGEGGARVDKEWTDITIGSTGGVYVLMENDSALDRQHPLFLTGCRERYWQA